jgi:hypothetical protein
MDVHRVVGVGRLAPLAVIASGCRCGVVREISSL